jgi:hypothetical protein
MSGEFIDITPTIVTGELSLKIKQEIMTFPDYRYSFHT